MARSFATGLFHGALTGAAGLAALSLLLPAPDPGGDALVPDAAVIATPAGSEFGRGEDAQPLLPAPLTRPAPAPLGGSGSVDAPPAGADAPLTDASTLTAERPETRADDPLAPPEIAPVTVDAEIPAAPPADNRTAPAAPERFESPAPDVEPLPMAASEPEAPGDDAPPSAMPSSGMPPSIAELPVVRPGLPEPPAAETPANMSALTRGRPEDGLGDDDAPLAETPADDRAADDMADAPDAAAGGAALTDQALSDQTSPGASSAANGATAEGRAAAADGWADRPEPAAEAMPETDIRELEDVGQPQAVTDAQPDPAAQARADQQQAAADSPADTPDGSPNAAQSGTSAGARDYPAMNLSTPPDIGGLLAGQ